MDSNLPRWIYSSMAKHFSTVASGLSLNYHVTGVDEPLPSDFQNDSSIFRMDGPVAYQSAGREEWYKVEIMILLTDIVQLTGDNAYDIYRWAGAFQASMLNDALQVFKYGSGVGDDQSLIGCLTPDPDLKNNVRVFSYGQLDKDLRILQVSVNGRFILEP